MKQKTNMQRWLLSLFAAVALAASASFCQAQSTIVLSNDTSESPAFYDGFSPVGTEVYTWQATGGPNGGGCIMGTIDGTTTMELDPAFNVSFNTANYYQVTLQLKIDSSSGETPPTGPPTGGYGYLQASFRDTSYSWNSEGYAQIFPPAANSWVTYTYTVPNVPNMAHLQFQLQASAGYSGPVTIYIGNVTILPVPNPQVVNVFSNSASVSTANVSSGVSLTWDSSEDAPLYNPVNNTGPIAVPAPGSAEYQFPNPMGYQGGQLNMPFNPSLYQWVAFDVYYDGPTPSGSTDFGGFQAFIPANGHPDYGWHYIGNYSFTAADVGTWKHFTFPCAAAGALDSQGLVFQSIPGSGAGTNAITFHVDNVQLWNPVTRPVVKLTKNTAPGGVQVTLDGNGNLNPNDQEGICTPSAMNADTNFFWVNQTPATYSFTLTNFPAPAAPFSSTSNAPVSPGAGYDAHIYLCNGDSMQAYGNDFGYNQTYSGANYNMVDDFEFHVENAAITNAVTYTTNLDSTITTNNSYSLGTGVTAYIAWKTNSPNFIPTNITAFYYPSMASANGTWALNFSDNTHGTVTAPDGSVQNFTLPDFYDDPNYTGSFTPLTSCVHIGVYKNGNTNNNNMGNVFTSVALTNTGVAITDNFAGPGLTASNAWQVAEYYQYAANRVLWIPAGTAYWLTWNSTQSGYSVLSTNSLSGSNTNWPNAGVTYTFTDTTGSNTVGAIPAASLPSTGPQFYEVMHP